MPKTAHNKQTNTCVTSPFPNKGKGRGWVIPPALPINFRQLCLKQTNTCVMSPFPIKGKGRGWVIPLAVMQSISIYRSHLQSSINFYKSYLQTVHSYRALLQIFLNYSSTMNKKSEQKNESEWVICI